VSGGDLGGAGAGPARGAELVRWFEAGRAETLALLARLVDQKKLDWDTQVTTLLHEDPSWGGIGRSVLVLCALWWAWASYAWLTNTVDAEDGLVVCHLGVGIWRFDANMLPTDIIHAGKTHRLMTNIAFRGKTLYATDSANGEIVTAEMPVAGKRMFSHR